MDNRMTEDMKTELTEQVTKEAADSEEENVAAASKEAVQAVEAMKAALTQQENEEVYITTGVEWRKVMKTLEEEIEKELGKANAVVNDVIAKERMKCQIAIQKEFAEKEKQLAAEYQEAMAALNVEHEAELEKMKKLYAEQLDETAETFKDKIAALRKEIDQYKEQVETLKLQIDDPYMT